MKRQDLADEIHGVGFVDWRLSDVGGTAHAKLRDTPHGRVWITETVRVTQIGPPSIMASSFSATIGFDRGQRATTKPHDSTFGALAEAVQLFKTLSPPSKVRRTKETGKGPLFGG